MKNIHKKRNLFGLIYALIMLLPMSSILVRCLYVTFNKNAFESYSDYKTTEVVKVSGGATLIEGIEYTISYSGGLYTGITYNVLNGNTNIVDLYFPNESWVVRDFKPTYEGTSTRLIVHDTNGQQHNRFEWENISSSFYFVNQSSIQFPSTPQTYVISQVTLVNGTLDNAFEYSLQTFVNDRGRGVLNLTDWFTSVFLEQNSHNQLYLDFVNWYMNYTLLISCVYLLYLVLMWFISLARRILTKYEEI